jgi:Ca2+-binding EF-hand superfamily protein
MIREFINKYKLRLATWLLDSVFNSVDINKDGSITKEELLRTAQKVDNATQIIVDILQR